MRAEQEDETEKPIRPYVFGGIGYGNPTDEAYDLAFDQPFFRYGGGFGMKIHDFAVEVQLRRGQVEETQLVASDFNEDALRKFYISTTEIQLRLIGRPYIGKFVFPAGFGIGLTSMTVDRGYPGVFDRFNGTGIYYGPFAGVEYPFTSFFSLGAEVEYALSEASFSGSEVWENQHSEQIDIRGGAFPATEDDFWDTVGGSHDNDFVNGGWIVSVRGTFYIPIFREGE